MVDPLNDFRDQANKIKLKRKPDIRPNSLIIKLEIHDPTSPKILFDSLSETTPQPESLGLKVNKDKKRAVDTQKSIIIILFLNN